MDVRTMYIADENLERFMEFVGKNIYPFKVESKSSQGFRKFQLPLKTSLSNVNMIRTEWLEFLADKPQPHENRFVLEMAKEYSQRETFRNLVLVENAEEITHITYKSKV
jgi:hypothetical protein